MLVKLSIVVVLRITLFWSAHKPRYLTGYKNKIFWNYWTKHMDRTVNLGDIIASILLDKFNGFWQAWMVVLTHEGI